MVKSISWPTADTTGSLDCAIARATTSSLKAHKSSIDPPAATDNKNIDIFSLIQLFNTLSNFFRRPLTLHFGGIKQDGRFGITSPDDMNHVTDRRPGRGGDNADLPRDLRELLFARLIEQTFFCQLFLELFKRLLESTQSFGFHRLDDDLVIATRFIDRDPSEQQYLITVFRRELHARTLAAKQDAFDLSLVVFQYKISVAGRGCAKIGNLPFDPCGFERRFENRPYVTRDFADGVDVRLFFRDVCHGL